ncbi:MAG: hypothetical protein K8S00_04180 [Bacteroidales bacterium]|nr:hypothetical protein [Bacteroidales bacterium]
MHNRFRLKARVSFGFQVSSFRFQVSGFIFLTATAASTATILPLSHYQIITLSNFFLIFAVVLYRNGTIIAFHNTMGLTGFDSKEVEL